MDFLKKATLHGKMQQNVNYAYMLNAFLHRQVAVLVIDSFSYDAVYNSGK